MFIYRSAEGKCKTWVPLTNALGDRLPHAGGLSRTVPKAAGKTQRSPIGVLYEHCKHA